MKVHLATETYHEAPGVQPYVFSLALCDHRLRSRTDTEWAERWLTTDPKKVTCGHCYNHLLWERQRQKAK